MAMAPNSKAYVFSGFYFESYWSKSLENLTREKKKMEKKLGCSLGEIRLVDECEYDDGNIVPW